MVEEVLEIDVEGASVALRVYVPAADVARGGAVVLLAGMSATMDSGLAPFAGRFAADGLVAVTFDYRHFGLSGGTPRQCLSVSKQLRDIEAVIAYTRSRRDVDEDRVGLWGSSFGGGLGVHTAVSDGRIRALVAQCPMMDRHRSTRMGFAGRSSMQNVRIVLLAAWASLVSLFGFRGPTLPMTDPNRFCVIPCDESEKFHRIGGPRWRNELTLQSFLRGGLHLNHPLGVAEKLHVPTLVQICDTDQTVSNEGTLVFIAKAGECVRATHYDCGHFDLYLAPLVGSAAEEASRFLVEHLSAI